MTSRHWGRVTYWTREKSQESSPATPQELICPCGYDRSLKPYPKLVLKRSNQQEQEQQEKQQFGSVPDQETTTLPSYQTFKHLKTCLIILSHCS